MTARTSVVFIARHVSHTTSMFQSTAPTISTVSLLPIPIMIQPNILFILTDQHWTGSIGCYGSTQCQTPNIDRLAREGKRFDNAYCITPICTPARASLQTGLFPSHHGMQTNIYTRGCMIHELPDHPTLLSRRLQQLGYQIGYTGKWHLGFGENRESQGEYQHHIRATPSLDRVRLEGCLPSTIGYEGEDYPGHGGCGSHTRQFREYLKRIGIPQTRRVVHDRYPEIYEVTSGPETVVSHMLTDQAIAQTDRFIDRGRPWFYMLNYWGPHAPYHASTPFLDLYRHLKIEPWPSFNENVSSKPAIHHAHRTETTARWAWPEFEEMVRMYYAAVSEIDANIGRLLSHLESRGVLNDTLVIFSADHGDALGVHRGLTDKSLFMYEETNRIPLIIRGPQNKNAGGAGSIPKPGTAEERFVGTCDLYSTILETAGLPRSESELDGRSLVPLLHNEPADWRERIVTESAGLDFLQASQRAVRWGHWKYVFNVGETDELYDLSQDPYELRNLAHESAHAGRLHEGRMVLAGWMSEHNDGLLERFSRMRGLVPRIDRI